MKSISSDIHIHSKIGGFTLIELMITLTVAAILIGIAIPSMGQFIRSNRMTAAANDLLTALYIARTESIKARAWTVMCASTTPNAATPACDGNGTQGWIVFVDNDNDGTVDVGETVSLRHSALASALTFTSNPVGNDNYLSYAPSGFAGATAALGTPVTSIVLCDVTDGNTSRYGADNSTARAIEISTTGRAAITRSVSTINTLGGCP